MKLRKRKSDRTVPLDEPLDTGEDTVVREIAVWDEDPEQQYSREELARFWKKRWKVCNRLSEPFSYCETSKN